MAAAQYNLRNPSVKRILQEAKELAQPTFCYAAKPLEDNIFEWHFTIRGASGTPFEGGIYHGRIILPPEYPFRPPHIMLLTPNGRFQINVKICLSVSAYHPEHWQPSWSIRTVLLALISFMPTPGNGAIGALEHTAEERRAFAVQSVQWTCPTCRTANNQLLLACDDSLAGVAGGAITDAERTAISQINFKAEVQRSPANEAGAADASAGAAQVHRPAVTRDATSGDGSGGGGDDATTSRDGVPYGAPPSRPAAGQFQHEETRAGESHDTASRLPRVQPASGAVMPTPAQLTATTRPRDDALDRILTTVRYVLIALIVALLARIML